MRSKQFNDLILPWILKIEGGYSNLAADGGGATNLGISLRYLKTVPDHDGDGFLDGDIDRDGDVDIDDIRLLTPEHAADRYYKDFWLTGGCDQMPIVVGLCLFDALVNHRPQTAKMLLQRGLGVKADGDIGPITRAAARHAVYTKFLPDYFSYRAVFYHDLVQRDQSQSVFYRGWLRRLFLLQQYLMRWCYEPV